MKMVSNRFTLSRTFSHFAEEMLARLALGSGRRISSTSLASGKRNIFRIDAVARGRSFHTFYKGKEGRRNNATRLLFGIHHAKREECRVVASAHF